MSGGDVLTSWSLCRDEELGSAHKAASSKRAQQFTQVNQVCEFAVHTAVRKFREPAVLKKEA